MDGEYDITSEKKTTLERSLVFMQDIPTNTDIINLMNTQFTELRNDMREDIGEVRKDMKKVRKDTKKLNKLYGGINTIKWIARVILIPTILMSV